MKNLKISAFFPCLLAAAAIAFAPISISLYGDLPSLTSEQIKNQASPAILYFSTTCPHCHKVIDYLKQIKKSVTTKDISNPMYKKELLAFGQKGVPVLVIGSQVVVGADQIISYLKQHPEVLR